MHTFTTEFSLGQSLIGVDDVIKIAKDNSLDNVIVTDTMTVTSMIPLAEKLGGNLITGVRLSIVEEAAKEKAPIFQPKIYPRDEKGMKVIYKYLTKSFDRPYFYMEPRLDVPVLLEMLKEAGHSLMLSTGDINGIFNHKRFPSLLAAIAKTTEIVVDVVPLHTARWDRLNMLAMNYAVKNNLEVFYQIPILYTKENADVFPIHYSIGKNVEFNFLNPWHQDYKYNDNIYLAKASMINRLADRFGAFGTPVEYKFDASAFYKWKPQDPKLPQLSPNPMKTLRKMAIDGFGKRLTKSVYGYKPDREMLETVYVQRLESELKVLSDLGFSDYFLLVVELTNWCRKQEIRVGPGRGSVGGSLVAFCLGITDVDPIRFGLMFERFINPTRLDLPDIDLDFMSVRRHEIIEHLNDRYGKDNVAGIINYSSLQSKSALRSTCRILNMDENDYACSKLIPSQFGFTAPLEEAKEKVIEVSNFAKSFPSVWKKATLLEGKMRNFSTHAAGIIVSSEPLINDTVIETRNDTRVINWDKKLCEKQGLIKLDALGLTTLDIIDLAIRYIKDKHGDEIVLENITLNDKHVLNAFSRLNTGGIFQFEGGSVKKLLKNLSKTYELTFEDLVAANALNRPGPIEAGLVEMYVDGKNGNLHDVPHSSMKEILEPTFNVMVYQEQIMKVAVEFAGYTLPEADNLRKIMGKKLPEEMRKESGKFVDGAIAKHGVERSLAQGIFDQISKFALYAFNKSHSVEYSLLSYICMWLKVYYPTEYYAASLTYIDEKKVRQIILEAKKAGIEVLPPSVNESTDKFNPVRRNVIRAPLNKIKYVSAAASHIMEMRGNTPFADLEDLEKRCIKRLVNKRVKDAMIAVGALDDIMPTMDPVCPVERSKALNDYLPSIPLGSVLVERPVKLTRADKVELGSMLLKSKDDNKDFVMPFIGKDLKFMVVTDSATGTEAKEGKFTESKGFNSILVSLHKADLEKANGYWTGLVKRQKKPKEKLFSNEVLEGSFEYLKREIEIIKPPVILALGSNVCRMFDPAIKGNAMDNAGKIIYSKEWDCNVIFGMNPGTIFFNPDYAETLNELFEIVSDMVK